MKKLIAIVVLVLLCAGCDKSSQNHYIEIVKYFNDDLVSIHTKKVLNESNKYYEWDEYWIAKNPNERIIDPTNNKISYQLWQDGERVKEGKLCE